MSYASDALIDAQGREIEKLKTENAKLRELVLQLVTPKQAIAMTVGTEPDELIMLKLHERMNAELIKFEQALGVEHVDGAAVVPFVARMHEIIEDAAAVGTGMLTAEQVRECVKGVYFEGYSDGATHRANGIEETDWQAIADKLNAMLRAGEGEI